MGPAMATYWKRSSALVLSHLHWNVRKPFRSLKGEGSILKSHERTNVPVPLSAYCISSPETNAVAINSSFNTPPSAVRVRSLRNKYHPIFLHRAPTSNIPGNRPISSRISTLVSASIASRSAPGDRRRLPPSKSFCLLQSGVVEKGRR